MMNKIILQPAGDSDALGHYLDTIKNAVELERIKPLVLPEEYSKLALLYLTKKVPVWGVTPGGNFINRTKWDRIEPGDVTLFSNKKGMTWEYIYFLDEIKELHIPYAEFNKVVGYAPNNVIQGFNVLDEDKSFKVIEVFNLKSNVYYPNIKESDFQHALRELDADTTLDTKRETLTRTEQSFLRKYLFQNQKVAKCGICGELFPVDLLITSHIKPRAKCSIEEKKDYKNIVIPMCCFGCDELYERGY